MARTLQEIFLISTKLGLTSFGGPIAHLGYFHEEYVRRRKWIDDASYADLVALCQFLPGPASSQVGIGIGVLRGGVWGGIAAWLGFTLPSALLLALFAYILHLGSFGDAGWIHGLKLVAVAVVAQAVLGMGQKLAVGKMRASIAVLTASVALLWPTAVTQVILILLAGLLGCVLWRDSSQTAPANLHIPISRRFALGCLLLFFAFLLVLPWISRSSGVAWLQLFDSLYRAGSLVYGGGHVVLPLLEREFVPTGLLSSEDFLAGYGAAQAVPGPLFTFASYLGAMVGGPSGAIVATLAIFLPAFLLVIGCLPFWDVLRSHPRAQGALAGINAAVVGILLAALYNPIWTSTILSPADFAMAAILFALLVFWKLPPWVVVVIGATGGWLLSILS
ncbi:chromate transporter [Brevibacillus composti]|uniref:Chromate transporter n=1 Tax=Brevibacillus composti TaxID=2796470 RepID=A0A7T5EHH3_9BACL|nr:chromate transporter [Brevibacillus composti]QQE72627.1 chromate transporter [Brevibacillus composti]QUO39705.1 chromate transporter [Brevibacillus composti]